MCGFSIRIKTILQALLHSASYYVNIITTIIVPHKYIIWQ